MRNRNVKKFRFMPLKQPLAYQFVRIMHIH